MAPLTINKPHVNYTHLKEDASCFNDNTCITIARDVEALSPQALISVVPTVFIWITECKGTVFF